jgi:ACS family tartrate transporter-like MFS transporter
MTTGTSAAPAEGFAPGLPERVMRKAQLRLLPLLFFAYMIAIIDRANISFAAQTMNADLGFSASVFGFAGGIFFVSYALLEVPSNMLMMRFGTRLWVTRIMISWGVISAAQMFVTTPMQFYALRFLLGAAEAGFFPAILYYASLWFPAQWRGRVISRFYVAQPVTQIVMGLVSGPILGLEGVSGLHGWQWLFLLEACPAIAMGFIIWRYLPDTPERVHWLAPDERSWLTGALAAEASTSTAHASVFKAISDPRLLMFGIIWFLCTGGLNAYLVTMQLILAEKTGFLANSVGQLTAVCGVVGVFMLLGVSARSDRRQERFWHIMLPWAVGASAFIALAVSDLPVVAIIAAALIAGTILPVHSVFYAALTEGLHERHRAVSIAAVNTFGQFGSFLATSGFGVARDATGSYSAGLAAIAAGAVVSVVLLNSLRRQTAAAAMRE